MKRVQKMLQTASRRSFLRLGAVGLAAAWGARTFGWAEDKPASLSKEEKAKLKEELQRKLERRVYNVNEALFRQINRAKNPKSLEGHERSHVPLIRCPRKVRKLEAFRVEVQVGVDEVHEMNPFHYIDWLGLRIDGVAVNHATLTPLFNRPIMVFEITLEKSARLTAREHCNLHGVWESEPAAVEVTG